MPSQHSNQRFKFLTGALATVLVIALLVNLGISVTGKVHESTALPTGYGLYDLQIELVNITINDSIGLTTIKIRGHANDSIAFGDRFHAQEIYVAVQNTTPSGATYVGNVFRNNAGTWENYILARYAGNTYGNYASGISLPNRSIRYYARTTNVTLMPVQIFITNQRNVNSYSGSIFIGDGYNTTTLQGGFWYAHFGYGKIGAIPSERGTNESYRSIKYYYYNRTAGPYMLPSSLYSDQVYDGWVKPSYQSPTATRIVTLNSTYLRLRQFPGYIALGVNQVTRFNYTCTDSDPTNDLFIAGAISMRHYGSATNASLLPSNSVYYPYTENARDKCVSSSNVSSFNATNATIVLMGASTNQVSCYPIGLPRVNINVICPTPACNAARTACAPATTTFTCTDTDEANNQTVPGNVTITSTGFELNQPDACTNSTPITLLQYSCSTINSTTITATNTTCPTGTTCISSTTGGIGFCG